MSNRSMRYLFAACFLMGAVPPVMVSAQSSCLPQGALSAVAVKYVVGLVSASDTTSIRIRLSHGLERAQASEVYVVADSAQCRSAALALQRTFGDSSGTGAPVWLLKAGPNRLVAFNSAHHDPFGSITSVVFDTLFVRKAILAGL
jgi:hypothetical protein